MVNPIFHILPLQRGMRFPAGKRQRVSDGSIEVLTADYANKAHGQAS
jgi:hypothetical protein